MGKNLRQYHLATDSRMFDFAEFYARTADNLPEGSVIAEVGVADGASSIYLAETLLNAGKAFDFWLIDSLAYGGADQLLELTTNLAKADLSAHVKLLALDSLNASCRFPDGHFDFVFIDASHRYELTRADILLWHRKLKYGGILAGHDYNKSPEGIEVKMAVDCTIPPANLMFEPTSKEFGVWWVKKEIGVPLLT